MIKTIKVEKQMRLDELIRHAFDNDVKDTRFESSNGSVIYFDEQGGFTLGEIFSVKKKSTFTVEVEEEITEDTVFQTLVAADSEGDACMMYQGTIDEIQDSITTEIYANINGKLELIWEAE